MIELSSPEFASVRALFQPLAGSQLFCAGVLEGLYTGRVWVDNRDNPRCGFVSKDNVWWFLAGDSHHHDFNQALHAALFDGTITGEKGWGGMLVCHPDDWDVQIPALFDPRIPIRTTRRHYFAQRMPQEWRAHVPNGFEVRFIDESLVASGLDVSGTVENVLELRRDAAEPDRKAVGFVAVHQHKIVAHAVIDCIVGGGGDIGLYTDEAFRQRGLAFLTAGAAIEYALAHGVEVVHWDCEAFNTGSIRTAEKLGLELSHEHTMYRLLLNPTIHEVNRAWAYLDEGRYDEAMAICQQRIEADAESVHSHFGYVLARCCADTNQPDAALIALELAAQRGWAAVDEARIDFAPFLTDPAWNRIIEQMQTNAEA